MMNAFSFNISSMSFLGSVKSAEVNALPIYVNGRLKLILMASCSHKFGRAMFSCVSFILHIHAFRNISKIAKTIVVFYPVYMVNIMFGKFASHVKPCETMCGIRFSSNVDMNIPGGVDKPRAPVSSLYKSGKQSGFWIVMKQFFETFLSKHVKPFISRFASSFEVGQDGDESSFQPLNLAQQSNCSTI